MVVYLSSGFLTTNATTISTTYTNPSSPSKASLIPTAVPIGTLFRPAPKTTKDLGTVNFNGPVNNNWNTQIPGNSGSGASMSTLGGHPKIKSAGTASLKWDFPSLTLAGTPPTLGSGGTNVFVPFSGSSVSSNGNFSIDPFSGWATVVFADPKMLNYSSGNVASMGASYDGAVQISPTGIVDYINANQGSVSISTIESINFRTNAEIISNSTNTFQVQFVAQLWREDEELLGVEKILGTEFSQIVNGVSKVTFSNATSPTIQTPLELPDGGDPDNYIKLFFKIKNTGGSAFTYTFNLEEVAAFVEYDDEGDSAYYPGLNLYDELYTGGGSPSERYQAGASNQAPTLAADYYSEAVVDVYLKRTGSYLGGDYDYIITSSVYDASTGLGGYSGSIYSGSILTFSDGPIEIYNDVPVSTNTQSSYNQVGDMYYVEYSMSRFKSGYYDNSQQIAQNIAFETDSDLSRIEITQSAEGSGASTYNATGSLKLRKYKLGNPVSGLGQEVLSIPFQPIGFTNPITVDIESPLTEFFEHDDVYKFSISLDKVNVGSGMLVQELTASIFPGQSIWAPLVSTPAVNNFKASDPTDFIVPTYYGDGDSISTVIGFVKPIG